MKYLIALISVSSLLFFAGTGAGAPPSGTLYAGLAGKACKDMCKSNHGGKGQEANKRTCLQSCAPV